MYQVDPKTLLFTNNLTWEEAKDLYQFCHRIVLEGYVNMEHPAYKEWIGTFAKNENTDEAVRQALLTYTIVFPQRALLSLVQFGF